MKALLLTTITFLLFNSLANADQLVCRGPNTTMIIEDIDGQDEPNFVYVQIFDSQDYLVYGEPLKNSLKTVKEVLSAKTFSSTSQWNTGSNLRVNMKARTLFVVTKNGQEISDRFSCRPLTPMKPVIPSNIGG